MVRESKICIGMGIKEKRCVVGWEGYKESDLKGFE
jgi:hypothetical protein